MGVSPTPKTVQEIGRTDAWYEPTRWPVFGPSSSDNEACANGLRANLSGRFKHETHPNHYPQPAPQSILAKNVSFSGLKLDAYKKTATVVVSWTVRAEAYQSVINPWTNNPRLCSPWHGTIQMTFGTVENGVPTGGEVVTMLYVNGSQFGREFVMTFPPLGQASSTNVSDPTITGSVVLRPADFGGEFPDVLRAEVRWINKTVGARAKSPAYMRNLTFFITPVAQQ